MIEIHHHDPDLYELRLNRPPANALNPELLTELRARLGEAEDRGARAIVLSGLPGIFSAGLDVPYLITLDRAGIEAAWSEFLATVKALARSPVPVVAAITGHSPAGGAVLSLACDYRLMARGDFTIGLNEVRLGIPMPRFMFEMARLAMGQRRAEIACASGHLFRPEEALAAGFVDHVAEAEEVIPMAIEHCRRLLQLPPAAFAGSRQSGRRDLLELFDRLDPDAGARLTEIWFSCETQAALKALVERLEG